MKNFKRYTFLISRILFGLTFLFSGFVKAVDPLGTIYKITDYLEAFGLLALDFLTPFLAFALITIEFLIGFCLLFNVKIKWMSILAALFMAVMTPLTLYLALENPVSDCGCFGDAIVLSNWQTFYKNIVLCLLLIPLFAFPTVSRPWLSNWGEWVVLIIPVGIALGICSYGYTQLPFIDFRPYKVGNNIYEGMQIPEDAPLDEYKTTFVYAKNGVEQEFTMEEAPYSDSTWTFVRQNSELIKKGYVPPIHDFTIVMDTIGDITDQVLSDPNYTLLVVSHKLEKAKMKDWSSMQKVIRMAQMKGWNVYWLTSSYIDEVNAFKEKYQVEVPFAATDDITLKTVVRSNPGFVLIKEGTIVKKWHRNNLPTNNELNNLIN